MLVCLFVFPKANTAGLLIELSSLGREDGNGPAFCWVPLSQSGPTPQSWISEFRGRKANIASLKLGFLFESLVILP